jgi:hypothetical protein
MRQALQIQNQNLLRNDTDDHNHGRGGGICAMANYLVAFAWQRSIDCGSHRDGDAFKDPDILIALGPSLGLPHEDAIICTR